MNNTMKKYQKRKVWLVIVILITLQVLLSVGYYCHITDSVEEQIKNNLKVECDGAKSKLQMQVTSKIDWLQMVASVASMNKKAGKTTQNRWWEMIQKYNREGSFRIGIADNKGFMYSGQHEKQDVSGREYYQKIMKGETVISPVMKNTFYDFDNIVIGTPILNKKGKAIGAVAANYTTLQLGNILNHTTIAGKGCNMVFDAEGKMVATLSGMNGCDTIYDMLKERVMDEGSSIGRMQRNVKNGKDGYLEYTYKNDHRILYYQSVGINDWTVISIASMNIYSDLLTNVKNNSARFLILSFLITGGAFWIMLKIFKEKTNALKKAGIDTLTGIYTRAEGIEKLNHRFENSSESCFGCVFIDVDDFKQYNDELGHEEGDRVLSIVGEAIRSTIRKQDIAYRFGGDEFCIWLFGTGTKQDIERVVNRIMDLIVFANDKIHVSVGVTVVDENEKDIDQILKKADEALYVSKRSGKNKMSFKDV